MDANYKLDRFNKVISSVHIQSCSLFILFFAALLLPIDAITQDELEPPKVTSPTTSNDKEIKPSNEQQSQSFDVDTLVERMKETDAIGFITKLSLKNKVDDILDAAKNCTDESSEIEKTELRSKFDGLILKAITLLNKGKDFNLAQDIYQAREQLWTSIKQTNT